MFGAAYHCLERTRRYETLPRRRTDRSQFDDEESTMAKTAKKKAAKTVKVKDLRAKKNPKGGTS